MTRHRKTLLRIGHRATRVYDWVGGSDRWTGIPLASNEIKHAVIITGTIQESRLGPMWINVGGAA